jgi:hypothetical protein
MGAWGSGVFENDDAGDWVWELEDDENGAVILEALAAVVDVPADEFVDVSDASNALAAAEVVASAAGRTAMELPGEAREWIGRNASFVTPPIIALARVAVERVATDSELKELWDEAADPAWQQVVDGLRDRLR